MLTVCSELYYNTHNICRRMIVTFNDPTIIQYVCVNGNMLFS